MIKIIKTEVNQSIEVNIPEGYVYDKSRKMKIDHFSGVVTIPIRRVEIEINEKKEM